MLYSVGPGESVGLGEVGARVRARLAVARTRARAFILGSTNLLNVSFMGAWQCEAGLALRPSGKCESTELWILLASSYVPSREAVASMMRTWDRTTVRLGLG